MTDYKKQLGQFSGTVLDIKRFAVHDGPGIRTTVFLKGCPLRCLWCHNPHSQAMGLEVSYDKDFCRYCGGCAALCENNCHEVGTETHEFDRENCQLCGECMSACVPSALKFVGCQMSVPEVMDVVLKDKNYYSTSGGGLTVSGGEPMSQFAFTKELLMQAKANELHTVLDTCGQAAGEKFDEILPFVDLVHYDLKESDTELHKKYTGVSLELILENLYRIDAAGAAIILRCPIVPGLNDRDEHLKAIADIAGKCPNIKAINIMPFHPYGDSHAMKIGMDFELKQLEAATEDQANSWISKVAAHANLPVSRG